MITSLAVRGFKNLSDIPAEEDKLVPFGSLNVLVGPNGCGKSSLLQAIDFLRAFFRSSVEVYLKERGWEYKDLPNLRNTRRKIRWEIEAQLDANEKGIGAGKYRYTVTTQPRRYLGVGEERLIWSPSEDEQIVLIERKGRNCKVFSRSANEAEQFEMVGLPASIMSQMDTPEDQRSYAEMLRFRDWVEGFRSYLIWDPKVLRMPDRGKHEELGPSGEHLASLIGHMKDRKPQAFKRLVRRVRELFPTVSDISVAGRGWGWRTIQLREGDGRGHLFNGQQMSDGVLRLLAITTLLYLDQVPTVLTFEEPENGIHPQLIRHVIQILRELTQRKPPQQCQVFLTTHSPYVLDEFFDFPEQVYCMDRPHPQAGATIHRLSENKQLNIVRDEFEHSLGEAWTLGLLGATAGISRR